MAKVHDKFVIELAEVIKGYGNDPDVDDPFHLSEFYRFYELPEIAVSENHFKTMIPLEVVEKNAQPGWIPCSERLPKPEEEVLLTFDYKKRRYVETGNIWSDGTAHCYADDYLTPDGRKYRKVVAWMPLPEPWKGEQE